MLVPVLANGPADPTDSSVWSADSDDKSVAGGVDDLGGDPVDAFVEFHHSFGLFQEPGDQPEVACGGAVDRGDGLGSDGVGDVQAQVGEGCGQDGGEFVGGQGCGYEGGGESQMLLSSRAGE